MEDGTLATLASSITNVSAVFALKGLEPAFVLILAANLLIIDLSVMLHC